MKNLFYREIESEHHLVAHTLKASLAASRVMHQLFGQLPVQLEHVFTPLLEGPILS
jgi:hypothetical protein